MPLILGRVMTTNPVVLSKDSHLKDALLRISDRGIGRVIVGKAEGIISTRDILSLMIKYCDFICSEERLTSLGEIRLSEVMTPDPTIVSPNEEIFYAIALMVTRNFGSLPVVEGEEPVGILVERDTLVLFQDMEEIIPVKQFITRRVNVADPSETLLSASHRMVRRGFRRLPVVEGGKVVGMVTAYDILKSFSKAVIRNDPTYLERTVRDIMTLGVEIIDQNASVNEAAKKMLVKRVGSLVSLNEEGNILGIITERDLLIALYHQLNLRVTGEANL